MLKWIGNMPDPRNPQNWVASIALSSNPDLGEAIQSQQTWLKDKVIGQPKPNDHYTVAQLEKLGFVGIYAEDEDV